MDITRAVDSSRVQILNVPEGYNVSLNPDSSVTIKMRGLQENLDQVSVDNLTCTGDISKWMDQTGVTELSEGSAEAEVNVSLPSGVTLTAPVKATLNIEKIPEDNPEE